MTLRESIARKVAPIKAPQVVKVRLVNEDEIGRRLRRALQVQPSDRHDCEANAIPYESDGALGHGWECGICGRFLQAG